MKKNLIIGVGILATAAATIGTVMVLKSPDEVRQDATTMEPKVTFDRTGNRLRIRGAFRVLRPSGSGRDHAVIIRLTVSQPGEGGLLVHTEDLGRINYHRNHKAAVTYPVHKDLDMDVTGLDVKVAAIDGKLEFASVIDHGGK